MGPVIAARCAGASKACRHRAICLHFGEVPKWVKCEACDNCGVRPEWVGDASVENEIPRLAARDDKSVRDRDERRIAGGDGDGGKRDGTETGRGRRRSSLRAVRDFLYAGQEDVEVARPDDAELADYLRQWRRDIAREKKVPAFVVLHDSTLEELCRRRPGTVAELMQVSGIGERKAEMYGAGLLRALRDFGAGARAVAAALPMNAPAEETLRFLNEGRTLEEIARLRGRQISTVIASVAGLIEAGRVKLDPSWISPGAQSLIEAACVSKAGAGLREIKDAVPAYVSFNDIRLVVAGLRAGTGAVESKSES